MRVPFLLYVNAIMILFLMGLFAVNAGDTQALVVIVSLILAVYAVAERKVRRELKKPREYRDWF